MVGRQSKWRRAYYAKRDKQQTTLAQKNPKKGGLRGITLTVDGPGMDEQCACPFCLGVGPLRSYLISTKKGIHQGLGKCPECKNGMRLQSLLAEWTPEQYAEWVYPYTADGFWQKCSFKIWSQRLRLMGWSYRFWKRYKELKGEDKQESYYDYIQRKQEEERAEMVDEHG